MNKDFVRSAFAIADLNCRRYQFVLSNTSSICKYYTESGETVRFTFDEKEGIFEQEEVPFIKELLNELLSRKGNPAEIFPSETVYYPYEGVYMKSKKIKCGNLTVDVVPVTGKLFDCVEDTVDEYNKMISSSKIYSIRVKGDKYGRFNNGKNS